MSTKRLRLGLAGLVALILVAAAAILGGASGGSSQAVSADYGEGPPALATHLDKLKQASPGNAEMHEGPGSAADADFHERAYPDTTISVAEMEGAREAFQSLTTTTSTSVGDWESIGPKRALYPFEDVRNVFNYVPNEYVAGGRTTAIDLEDGCRPNDCEAWITPAGGGAWHTYNALSANPQWHYRGGPLGINAAGAVRIDPHDSSDDTVYVGTGEANICGSGCVAGTGLYRTTNHGHTWTKLGGSIFDGMGIGEIVIHPDDPDTLYVGTTTALRGMSSVCCSGVTRPVPGISKWGLYKSTDAGATWSFIHNGAATTAVCTGDLIEFSNAGICSPRGVRHVELDPSNPDIVYASSYARGVWRSSDGGATWVQIKPSLNAAVIQTRAAFDVNTLPNGDTRMYVYEGNAGQNTSRLFRSDSVATGVPVFTDLTSPDPALPGFAWHGNCDPQCWYDLSVYTPAGFPDIVYVAGDYSYGEVIANKRGVVLSTDAGVSGTDMTFDGTDSLHPNGIHPDQHDLETVPGQPFRFFETGDGGVVRSNGNFVNRSNWCDNADPSPNRNLNPVQKARCEQMLSRIPERLTSLNNGLNTLQFQSLSISPHDSNIRQGGTQDNGTWETNGNRVTWRNMMIGDGGQSGFDVAIPEFRFHTFTGVAIDVNFDNGDIDKWIWVSGNLNQAAEFYSPVISDPVVSKTMFAGAQTVNRTKTAGLGARTYDQAQAVCNEWTGTGPFNTCGDWVELGAVRLTNVAHGDRAGGNMSAVERTKADTSSAWAATSTGRVFITKNVDAEPGAAVTWTRLDDDSAIDPNRYVSSIHVDSANGNRAWISYSGYGVNTPATPGHVFEVVYDPVSGLSTWTNLSHNLGDLPVTDLVRDDMTGDLYSASDFGVMRLPSGSTTWGMAGGRLPNVEVAGLTIVQNERQLYAATHGLSAWLLDLD